MTWICPLETKNMAFHPVIKGFQLNYLPYPPPFLLTPPKAFKFLVFVFTHDYMLCKSYISTGSGHIKWIVIYKKNKHCYHMLTFSLSFSIYQCPVALRWKRIFDGWAIDLEGHWGYVSVSTKDFKVQIIHRNTFCTADSCLPDVT